MDSAYKLADNNINKHIRMVPGYRHDGDNI